MTKAKGGKKSKERASVSRERKLALATRGLLDSLESLKLPESPEHNLVAQAEMEARTILSDLGYSGLVGIFKRVAALNEQLAAALAAGDGKEIARLGVELQRAQQGKEPTVVKAKAATAAKE